MLAKLAPKFVISRVIQNSYLAQNQAIQLLKIPLGSHYDYFTTEQPQDFQTVKFYGYISSLSKPQNFANKYEQQAYSKACERFKQFNETYAVYDRLAQLQLQARQLYSYVERNSASSNLFSQRLQTDKSFENDLLSSIQKYTKVQDSLAEYPEWQTKIKSQIGGWYHLIHNSLAQSDSKRRVFNKLHRQEYFV